MMQENQQNEKPEETQNPSVNETLEAKTLASKENDEKNTEPAKATEEKNSEPSKPIEEKKDETSEPAEENNSEPPAIEFRDVDQPYADDINEMLSKHNVPAEMRQPLYKAYLDLQDKIVEQMTAKSEKDLEEWKEEQGTDLAKSQELARRGATVLGMDQEQTAKLEFVLGTKPFMELCKRLGDAVAEDNALLFGAKTSPDKEMSGEDFYKNIFDNNK